MIIRIALACLIWAPLAVEAAALDGVVSEAGTPVAGARVTLFTPALTFFAEARSGADGSYRFDSIPPGTYRLGVSSPGRGYEELEVQLPAVSIQNVVLGPETEPGRWDVIGSTAPEFLAVGPGAEGHTQQDSLQADLQSADPRWQQALALYEEYRRDFPEVPAVAPGTLRQWLERGEIVLVDVRSDREREVSIIPGAVSREAYESRKTSGQRIVTYCTIGYRSGKYAEKLRSDGIEAYNLIAGILGWVHAAGELEHEGKPTRNVHVYGRRWNLLPPGYEPRW